MYETRLLGSGGQAKGLAGVGGPSRGPVDVLLNGLVGLLVAYLVWTLVEPFWQSAIQSSREVRLQGDLAEVTKAIQRYEVEERKRYVHQDLSGLSRQLQNVPVDPWNQPYRVDPFFGRVLSGGPDGALGLEPEAPESQDDIVQYYRPVWRVRFVVEEGGVPVPYVSTMDGARPQPAGGDFFPGVGFVVQHPVTKQVVYAATGVEGNADLAHFRGDEPHAWLVESPGPEASPAFDGEGAKVVFSGIRDNPDPQLYQVPHRGGEVVALTSRPDDVGNWRGDHAPDVDPVNGHVAFHSARREDDEDPWVSILQRGKPGGRVVVLRPPAPPGTSPRWEPGGKGIWYLEKGGRNLIRLAFPPRGKFELRTIPLPAAAECFELSPEVDAAMVGSNEDGLARLDVVDLESKKSRKVFVAQGRLLSVRLAYQ